MTRDHQALHREIWAVSFNDPSGNRYELNTYDYQTVWKQLHIRTTSSGNRLREKDA